jgi:hypothetical protein
MYKAYNNLLKEIEKDGSKEMNFISVFSFGAYI